MTSKRCSPNTEKYRWFSNRRMKTTWSGYGQKLCVPGTWCREGKREEMQIETLSQGKSVFLRIIYTLFHQSRRPNKDVWVRVKQWCKLTCVKEREVQLHCRLIGREHSRGTETNVVVIHFQSRKCWDPNHSNDYEDGEKGMWWHLYKA